MEGQFFNVDQQAQLGLPPGVYILQLSPIEAGIANSKFPKLTFSGLNCQDTATAKAGKKHVWSYTMQPEYLSIIAGDLVRAGIHGNVPVRAPELAAFLNPQMQGQYYIISVTQQKKDPSRTNTSITGPYGAQAQPPGTPVVAPTSVPPVVAAGGTTIAPPPMAASAPFPGQQATVAPPASAAWPTAPTAVPGPALAAVPPPLPVAAVAPAPVQAAPSAAAVQAFQSV